MTCSESRRLPQREHGRALAMPMQIGPLRAPTGPAAHDPDPVLAPSHFWSQSGLMLRWLFAWMPYLVGPGSSEWPRPDSPFLLPHECRHRLLGFCRLWWMDRRV